MQNQPVVTRIAPSPTGTLHIGTARTALFNYLFARKNNGRFLIRIEDTDKERGREEFEKNITEGLEWLGLKHDGEITRQSERTGIYKKYLEELINSGKARFSRPGEEGEEKKDVIRLVNNGSFVGFKDIIRGEINFDTKELGDFVIAKSIEEPLYHLAVVIDDFEMKITHVIRGEDHISNTPRQILIQEALGFPRPQYAHLPLILATDRSKLSKRHGAVSISTYRELGYLPETLVNFMALLGWSPQNKTESAADDIFSMETLIKKFDLEKVGKSGAVFNLEKLDSINRHYLAEMPVSTKINYVRKFFPNIGDRMAQRISPIVFGRINRLSDVQELIARGEFNYLTVPPVYKKDSLFWKKDPNGRVAASLMTKVIDALATIPEEKFEAETLKTEVLKVIGNSDRGSILWPMRYALTGKDKSPDPFTVAEIVGKNEVVDRLKRALSLLES